MVNCMPVAVKKDSDETVDHVPKKISQMCSLFYSKDMHLKLLKFLQTKNCTKFNFAKVAICKIKILA